MIKIILENSFTKKRTLLSEDGRPKNSKTGKLASKLILIPEQTLSETLILAQDERWRRA